jgi:hypothetical protein
MSARNGKANGRKAATATPPPATAAGGCDREAATTTEALATAATVAHRIADQGEDLAALLHHGCAAEVGKLALVVLVDCRRRLARLAEKVERAQR